MKLYDFLKVIGNDDLVKLCVYIKKDGHMQIRDRDTWKPYEIPDNYCDCKVIKIYQTTCKDKPAYGVWVLE